MLKRAQEYSGVFRNAQGYSARAILEAPGGPKRLIFAYSSNGFAVFIEKRNRLRALFQKLHFCYVNKQVSGEQRKIRVRIEETSHRRSVSKFECAGKMLFRADSSSGLPVFIGNRTSPRTFFRNSHFSYVNTSISVRKFYGVS